MKKLVKLGFLLILVMTLTACAENPDVSSSKPTGKEGVAPFVLTEGEKNVLRNFAMENTSQIVSFLAPKEANILDIKVYRLEADGSWGVIGSGGMALDEDREPNDRLSGTFAMILRENYAIDFFITANGSVSYKTEEILLEKHSLASAIGFLPDHQEIALNTEIPIALMAYSRGSSMNVSSLQDFFEPSKFVGMDLVQFVTMTFSDE